MPKRVSKGDAAKIGSERIERLMFLSERETLARREDRARRYVSLARRIGKKTQVSVKGTYCKECNSFLYPGINCRVRFNDGKRTVTCLTCGKTKRMPFR